MPKAIPVGVGLILDEAAFEKTTPGKWRIRESRRQLGPGEKLRVTGGEPQKIGCREVTSKPCSGVLVRTADSPSQYLVTTSHSNLLEYCMRIKMRFVTGLADLTAEIDETQVFRIGPLRHYEDSYDRDIAIFDITPENGDELGEATTHRLPRDATPIMEGRAVYIVGHSGGEALQHIVATIKRRLPPEAQHPARGMNLQIGTEHSVRKGLSGAPVFDGDTNELLGVIQGGLALPDRLVVMILRRLFAVSTDKHEVLSLLRDAMSPIKQRDINDAETLSPVLLSALSRSPLRLSRKQISTLWLETGVPNITRIPLERRLSRDSLKRLMHDLHRLEAILSEDAHAVFLGGAMSDELY